MIIERKASWDRDVAIHRAREDGATFKAIAEQFNLSKHHVTDVYYRTDRQLRRERAANETATPGDPVRKGVANGGE
jgi:hypothetical protein